MRNLLLITLLILVTGCTSESIFVGNQEYLTFTYSNSNSLSKPEISTLATSKSSFISFDQTSVNQIGNNRVEIIIDGVRVENSRKNFAITGQEVVERSEGILYKNQDEFTNDQVPGITPIAVVLVLDMSTSLRDEINNLKSYAKDFVDQVVSSTNQSLVSVVFFSGRDNINATQFHDYRNAEMLKAIIDLYENYEEATALFQATINGKTLLDNLNFEGAKSLVVFTDGGENDSDFPETLRADINNISYSRFGIGLEGKDFEKSDLQSISSNNSNMVIAKTPQDLEGIFKKVAKQVLSVYRVSYIRSDQLLENELDIKFKFEIGPIE